MRKLVGSFAAFAMLVGPTTVERSAAWSQEPHTGLPSGAFGALRGPGEADAHLIREVGEDDYTARTFPVYTSYCDDYVAEECGIVSFACTVQSDPQRPKVSVFGIEPYQLVAMLQTAANLLPSGYDEMVAAEQIALREDAFRLRTDLGELKVQYVDELTLMYDLQFGFWSVSVQPETNDLKPIVGDAKWLSIAILGKETFIDSAGVLKAFDQFISSCAG